MVFVIDLNQQGHRQLMARQRLEFSHFGITESPEAILDQLLTFFNEYSRGNITIDELLLHPHDAIQFCNHVRTVKGWFGVPEDMLLRPILNWRKSSN